MTPIILFLFVAVIYVQGRQVEQTAKIDYLWNKQVSLIIIYKVLNIILLQNNLSLLLKNK